MLEIEEVLFCIFAEKDMKKLTLLFAIITLFSCNNQDSLRRSIASIEQSVESSSIAIRVQNMRIEESITHFMNDKDFNANLQQTLNNALSDSKESLDSVKSCVTELKAIKDKGCYQEFMDLFEHVNAYYIMAKKPYGTANGYKTDTERARISITSELERFKLKYLNK